MSSHRYILSPQLQCLPKSSNQLSSGSTTVNGGNKTLSQFCYQNSKPKLTPHQKRDKQAPHQADESLTVVGSFEEEVVDLTDEMHDTQYTNPKDVRVTFKQSSVAKASVGPGSSDPKNPVNTVACLPVTERLDSIDKPYLSGDNKKSSQLAEPSSSEKTAEGKSGDPVPPEAPNLVSLLAQQIRESLQSKTTSVKDNFSLLDI